MDDNKNQNGGSYADNTQQNWAQQQSQRPVVINELANKKDSIITTSLVLGILAIVFCWVPGLSSITGLIGIILGIVSVAETKQHRGLAIAGIITSAVGLVLSILLTLIYVLLMF